MKVEAKVYFEDINQLNNREIISEIPDFMRDGKVVHWTPKEGNSFYRLNANTDFEIICKEGNYFLFNKLAIYLAPVNGLIGETQGTGAVWIWYLDRYGNWQELDFEDFNEFCGFSKIEKEGNKYSFNSGIIQVWNKSLDLIEAVGLKIRFNVEAKITEIVISSLWGASPLNFRISEDVSIENEYKGLEANFTFFDSNFEIKNKCFYNQVAYIFIKDGNKNKEKRYMVFVDKIFVNVGERITNIYFSDVITRLKDNLVQEEVGKQMIKFNELVQLLLLQSNIHSDSIECMIEHEIEYVPSLRSIYDELFDLISNVGDIMLLVVSGKIIIKERGGYRYEIVKVLEEDEEKISEVVKGGWIRVDWNVIPSEFFGGAGNFTTLFGLARIEFNDIIVDNFFTENFGRLGFIENANLITFGYIPLGSYRFKFIEWGDRRLIVKPNGFLEIKSYLFNIPRTTQNAYLYGPRVVVFEGRYLGVLGLYMPGQNFSIKADVYVWSDYLNRWVKLDSISNLQVSGNYSDLEGIVIEFRFEHYVHENLQTTSSFGYAVYDWNSEEVLASGGKSMGTPYFWVPNGEYIKIAIYNIGSGDFMFDIIKNGAGWGKYSGFRFYFNTEEAVEYNTIYAKYSNFPNLTTKSINDLSPVFVEDGKVKSQVGDHLWAYFYGDMSLWKVDSYNVYFVEYVYGKGRVDRWVLKVNYEGVGKIIGPISLTYKKIEDVEIEEGIVDIEPKEIKIIDSKKFYRENLLVNFLKIYLSNWVVSDEEVIYSEKVPFILRKTYYVEASIDNHIVMERESWLEIEINGIGVRTYQEGVNYDDMISCTVEYRRWPHKISIKIVPWITVNWEVIRLEVKGYVWEKNEVIREFRDEESIRKYGVITKEVKSNFLTNDEQVAKIVKKIFRFLQSPPIVIGEEIYTVLNLSVDFLRLAKIYDEIQNKAYLFKVIGYEHYVDISNNIYETIIRGRLLRYEDYYININYWGNKDYWGDHPVKYWGGEYYG